MSRLGRIKHKVYAALGDIRPVSMQLEVTNACNFRCVMCPFHGPEKASDRPVGFMSLDRYTDILKQFRQLGGTFLIPQGAGESLLHPQFREMLRIAVNTFRLEVGLNTNGSRLTESMMTEILDLGIREIGFSVDALKAETFRAITGGELAPVETAVETLVAMRNRRKSRNPRIRVLIVEQAANLAEIPEYIDRWVPVVDEVIVQARRINAGRELETPRQEVRRPCRHLFDTVFVQWDGEMVICCEDWESVTGLGNVFETALADLWRNPVMQSYRRAQQTGQWAPPEICRHCEAWAGGSSVERHHDDRIEIAGALTRTFSRKQQ